MDDKMTSFERRIEILFFLMRVKETTITELSKLFSVCWRTAYNDIVFLSRYAPIYTKSGNHGGVYLLEGYRNELFIYLSADEEELLIELQRELPPGKKTVIRGIIHKFSAPKKVHTLSERG